MPDGTVYRLWRVQGEFRNDFELQRFPFDVQTLQLPFFNARAAADRIVYIVDKRTPAGGRAAVVPAAEAAAASGITVVRVASAAQGSSTANIARISSPNAFRNLSQWDALETRERRENVVTDSALGDPRRVGAESYRELSGYLVAVDVQRRALATLFKNMLPLLMMTMVMYASLYFPVALVKEKVTVAVTGALSGAVLLTAINSQLGNIGYTIAVEYAFFVFFGLSLLCIVSVLGAERLRAAGRTRIAVQTERWTSAAFLVAVGVTIAGATSLYVNGR